MPANIWTSPDGAIHKVIKKCGTYGYKPSENCECEIFISDVQGDINVEKFNNAPVVLGDIDSKFGRLLDIAISTMLPDEVAHFEFRNEPKITFTMHLKSFTSNGLIYEWDAKKKYDLAMHHKTKGVELFNSSYIDAFHRFAKGLKLLASIPIAIDEPPSQVDGILVEDIEKLRINLKLNLASCYSKARKIEEIIYLCTEVLKDDKDNVKALYKISVAHYDEREYEKSHEYLKHLLELEPNNKLAIDRMKLLKPHLQENEQKSKALAKKMFGIIGN